MEEVEGVSASRTERLRRLPAVGMFFETAFLHYAWTGAFISILNIFLLWLFIDVIRIETVVASTIVIGGTFILRYVLFRILHIV